jgi:hypothetical protein
LYINTLAVGNLLANFYFGNSESQITGSDVAVSTKIYNNKEHRSRSGQTVSAELLECWWTQRDAYLIGFASYSHEIVEEHQIFSASNNLLHIDRAENGEEQRWQKFPKGEESCPQA